MKKNQIIPTLLASLAIITLEQASAHISYSGRDFGSYTGGDVYQTQSPIALSNISSDFGWAAATDADFGDSHRTRAFRFHLENPGTVAISVQSAGSGFLPGMSLYAGLSHLSPNAGAHDGSALSQQYLLSLPGPTKLGSLYALGDWAVGNDPVYTTPNDPQSGVAIDASLRYFDYIGNIADGSNANFGFADGINGDGVADGFITGSFNLAAGDYSFFVGGANLATESQGPTWTSYGSTVSVTVIPEASSAWLIGLSGVSLCLRRRRN